MADPWFKFYPSDWLGGTRDLTAEETGVYITLLALIYDHSGYLMHDPASLARQCGCRPAKFSKLLSRLIERGKIIIQDGRLTNLRAQIELKSVSEKRDLASLSASVRWQKDKGKQGNGDANAMRTHVILDATRSQIPDIPPKPPTGGRRIKGSDLFLQAARKARENGDEGTGSGRDGSDWGDAGGLPKLAGVNRRTDD